MSRHPKSEIGLLAPEIIRPAIRMAFAKLDPQRLMRNPVIFATALVALLATVPVALHWGEAGSAVNLQIALWLWATVPFANFAEAVAEGRGNPRRCLPVHAHKHAGEGAASPRGPASSRTPRCGAAWTGQPHPGRCR